MTATWEKTGNIKGPTGPTGPTGSAGATGPTGPQGAPHIVLTRAEYDALPTPRDPQTLYLVVG